MRPVLIYNLKTIEIMENNANQIRPTAPRVVKTSRWIRNSDLKIGMYVRELDHPWEQTNFMFQGFVIENPHLLDEVRKASEYVCIEPERLS